MKTLIKLATELFASGLIAAVVFFGFSGVSLAEDQAQSASVVAQAPSLPDPNGFVPVTNTPEAGIFWSLTGQFPPTPFNPMPSLNLFWGGVLDNYIYDDSGVDDWTEVSGNRVANDGRTRHDDGPPSPPGGDSGGTNSSGGDLPGSSFPTNGLYLQMLSLSSGISYLNICNATDYVYEVWSTTDLTLPLSNWAIETEVFPTNSSVMPFAVEELDRTNALYFFARDWTGITSLGNTVPEWWAYYYFNSVNIRDTNLDAYGYTLLFDYENGLDPNPITFSLAFSNYYVNSFTAQGQISLTGGTPSFIAIQADNTNLAMATWMPYTSSNFSVFLGTNQCWHQVFVGLRGLPVNARQTWVTTMLRLEMTAPAIVLTNPTASTVTQPTIQLQGYATDGLTSLTYDLSNTSGTVTGQPGFIVDQGYDTNMGDYTTNFFQCFDVPVVPGINTVTFHATDFAGNITTTNFTFTLDYSSKTNPPMTQIYWPTPETQISGSTFILNGWISDPTAQVTIEITDQFGDTNTAPARVGREGDFWVENLPLAEGTNNLTVTVSDAVGNTFATNFPVLQSALDFAITSAGLGQAVTGTISDTNYSVWVNGTLATNNGDGTWVAQDPHLTLNTPVVQVRAIPSSDNGGNGTPSSGGGAVAAASNPGNPGSTNGTDAEMELCYPDGMIYCTSAQNNDTEGHQPSPWPPPTYFLNWSEQGGGTQGADGTNLLYTWFPGGSWPEYPGIIDLIPNDNVHNLGPPEGAVVYSGFFSFGGDFFAPWAEAPGNVFMNVLFQYNDRTQLTMTTGGMPGSKGQELYSISGSAGVPTFGTVYPYGTPSISFPSEQIKISTFGYLDSDANLYTVLPTYSRIVVTENVPGESYIQGAQSAGGYPMHIYFNSAPVVDTNVTVIVGQNITLTCAYDYASGPWITNYTWTVPGNALSNFYVSSDPLQTNGYPQPLTALTNPFVNFFWAAAGTNKVTCSVVTEGVTNTYTATFNVVRPTPAVSTRTGSVFLDTSSTNTAALRLGDPYLGEIPGFTAFLLTNAMPVNVNYDYEWIQTIQSININVTTSNVNHQVQVFTTRPNILDNSCPYPDSFDTPVVSDTPAVSIHYNGETFASYGLTNKMWLMFRPTGGSWVPLYAITWGAVGAASLSGNTWSLLTPTNISVISSGDSGITYPSWTNNFANTNQFFYSPYLPR